MPPVSIKLPAWMKNGIAAKGNLLMEENILFTDTNTLTFPMQIPKTAASPINTATEMVSAKHSTIVVSKTVDIT